jgi:hypothetical protein
MRLQVMRSANSAALGRDAARDRVDCTTQTRGRGERLSLGDPAPIGSSMRWFRFRPRRSPGVTVRRAGQSHPAGPAEAAAVPDE